MTGMDRRICMNVTVCPCAVNCFICGSLVPSCPLREWEMSLLLQVSTWVQDYILSTTFISVASVVLCSVNLPTCMSVVLGSK